MLFTKALVAKYPELFKLKSWELLKADILTTPEAINLKVAPEFNK